MKTQNFQIYDYDIWGNKKDGFEVNDVYCTPLIVELKEEYTDNTIIRKLKEVGFIKNTAKNCNFEIEGDFDHTLYINYNGSYFMPMCELRPIQEDNQ
jgi:hypothetical protein